MLKSISILSNYYKINSISTTLTTTTKFIPTLIVNNYNINETIISSPLPSPLSLSYQIANYSNKKRGPNLRRNSYTHGQDVRKIKRRESRATQNEILFEDNIKPIDSTEPIPKNKPSHLHSKPITHKEKLETLEHHHQKKLLRDQKFKDQQRKLLINTLEEEKQQQQQQQQQEQQELEQEQQQDEQDEDHNVNKKRKQKKQLERLKQFGFDTIEPELSQSEGKTEYSSFTNKIEEFEDQSTFEADLSTFGGNKNIKFDLSKIQEFNPADELENLSSFDDDDDVSISEEAHEMTLEDAHKRFNFSDDELEMLNRGVKEKFKKQQQQQQQKQKGIEEDEEEEEDEELIDEIEKYETILNEKKNKLLMKKQNRKQLNLDLKKEKTQQNNLDKQLKSQKSKQEIIEKQGEEDQEKREVENSKSNKKVSSTQINYLNSQKVIEHIQELHNKKMRESKTYKEKDLSPVTIDEVMNFLATTHLDDFCVIDISKKCTWAEYLVIASSDSTRLLSNTEKDIMQAFKHRFEQLHPATNNSDQWRVVDLNPIVIHLFETQTREYYDLENLWVTRRETDWEFEESWDDEMTSRIEEDKENDDDGDDEE
ncbi:hypothetical protein DDB_G0293938 [Dictyostelium discoideum AX4]|uniref:Uncharacterized protein n=1 Tax=Dictyostelium discoideum TaxID=44689 RepID=Q54B26_DICDI|nr:hypothetical protein DDB_G0293938 [Dictyostelium discoideum AX4]EAL60468.1 hypothetical protein DDB_G0293938 [Dictyostelium discoideum AX4]|eukprot:XP_628890.1 hypothetical protein DDB_G0293938 [Dictyostelium discoideum AX4]